MGTQFSYGFLSESASDIVVVGSRVGVLAVHLRDLVQEVDGGYMEGCVCACC